MATTITKWWQNNVGCLNGGDRRGDLLDGSQTKRVCTSNKWATICTIYGFYRS